MVGLLDSLISKNDKNITNYEPLNPQYNSLKSYLLKYYEIEKKKKGWVGFYHRGEKIVQIG